MKSKLLLIVVILSLTACAPVPTQDRQTQLQTIVASTLTSQPTSLPAIVAETAVAPELLQTPVFTPVFTPDIPTVVPTVTSTVVYELSEQDRYQVTARPNAQNGRLSDLYVNDLRSGNSFLFISLKDIDSQHYHVGEYRHGNLYVIGETGSGEDLTNELWRYDSQGNGKMLFSEPDLDFRVSPDERFIGVKYNLSGRPSGEKLSILQSQGKVKKKFNAEDLGQLGGDYTIPLEWSDDGSYFWAGRHTGLRIYSLHRIAAGSWSLTNYSVASMPVNNSAEFDLNGNTGKIVFSDYPPLFDVDSRDRFKASGQPVTLYVYDLNRRDLRVITTSTAKPFLPKWVNASTVEYNDPNGDGKIVYVLP